MEKISFTVGNFSQSLNFFLKEAKKIRIKKFEYLQKKLIFNLFILDIEKKKNFQISYKIKKVLEYFTNF